jgi:hypothetical protein
MAHNVNGGRSFIMVAALLCIAAAIAPAWAERPSAMKLFPEETVVFVRMANAHEFGERFQQTAMGRMINDPQLKPFLDHLYGGAGEFYADKAQGKLGVSWEDLKRLPKGEVAFGIIARPNATPALLVLIDQGDEPSVAEQLLDRALELAGEDGAEFSTEKIGDVEVTIARDADNQNRVFGVFERENTIVAATDPNVIRNVLWHWDGSKPADGQTNAAPAVNKGDANQAEASAEAGAVEAEFVPGRMLAENERFGTILQHCRRPQDPPPHVIWFVDPIELVRAVGRDNGSVQFALGLLPSIGLDGLHALGGALTYATDQYDQLSQVHLLLGNPRAGVLQVPAFEQSDTAPQPWVPRAVETYMSFSENLRTSYDRIIALIDQYRYQGATAKFVERRLSEPLGIDVPTKIFDNLAGRFTWIVGYDSPATLRRAGQQHIFAARLKDEAAGQESLKTVMDKHPDFFEERRFGSVTYHAILPPRLRETEESERPFTPFVAIMDGYFFIGGSCSQFERCIAARDGTVDRLIDSEDYSRASEVVGREAVGAVPVLFSISRFEETVKQWYGLLTSPKTRELIDEHKEGNRFLAALADSLDANELPPFEVLAPYFGPGGGILYDTDTGYHGIGFTLRNEPAK